MGKLVYDITVLFDGFITGPENPLGDGGMRLFDELAPVRFELERIDAIPANDVTHMRVRVINTDVG
ncbi:MAG TPA: hypothetical protein VFQ54_12560 [Thermomicrobiales bacterium]|nr:hypothetical protein [Thermomicrobiales bacterium]